MQEVAAARALLERALDRLEQQPADHPLKRIDPVKLRRLLAEAAFRELRELPRSTGTRLARSACEEVQPAMPYDKISDLPQNQVDQYSHHQKEAFLEAFNNAYEEYGHDESRAFAVAHAAAKRTPEQRRGSDD